jgi:endo-1,4-beta-xylanase
MNILITRLFFSVVFTLFAAAQAHAGLRDLPAASGRVKVGSAAEYYHSNTDPRYLPTLAGEYNIATPENSMKMAATEPTSASAFSPTKGWDFSEADSLVDFARDNGMVIRGHNLVWAHYNPSWLAADKYSASQLRSIMRNRITTEITYFQTHYPNVVQYWDVVNEALTDGCSSVWVPVGGPTFAPNPCLNYVFTAFKIARDVTNKINPRIKLFYNDNGGEATAENCSVSQHTKACQIYQLVAALRSQGLIDGVGLETHWSTGNPKTVPQIENNIHQLGRLGLEVQITELDDGLSVSPRPGNTELENQGGVYFQVAQACMAEPNCTAIVTWEFMDGDSWLSSQREPLPFSSSYEKKPAYYALQAALGGTVNLTSLASNLCGEDPGSESSGTLLRQNSCAASGSSNQLWKLKLFGESGSYNIISGYSNLCMDVVGASTHDGAQVQQYRCVARGQANQLWEILAADGGYQIRSVNSSNCLETVGSENGSVLEQNACSTGANQIWKFDLSY